MSVEIECPECLGQGWEQVTEAGHGCDGTDEVCAVTCPVPVPAQVECGHCDGAGRIEISEAEAEATLREAMS